MSGAICTGVCQGSVALSQMQCPRKSSPGLPLSVNRNAFCRVCLASGNGWSLSSICTALPCHVQHALHLYSMKQTTRAIGDPVRQLCPLRVSSFVAHHVQDFLSVCHVSKRRKSLELCFDCPLVWVAQSLNPVTAAACNISGVNDVLNLPVL